VSPWPTLLVEDARRFAAAYAALGAQGKLVPGRGLPGGAAMSVFRGSPCRQEAHYAAIWTLSDVDADGHLTLPEFVLASYFLERAAEGRYGFFA